MSFDLKINSVSIELGGTLAEETLEEADFRKVGHLKRLIKQLPSGQVIYTADNCQLKCFNDEFSIYPCTHGYLNRDRQWETRASVYLDEGKVLKLEFQVIDGHYAAPNFLDRFQDACSSVLGEPVEHSRFLTRWHNGTAAVTSILHQDMVNVDFLMELIPDS